MSRANPATTHDNAGIAAWRFNLKAEISSWDDCMTFLYEDGDTSLLERELGPHMKVTRELGYCAVVLYATEIIRYYPDGTFSVDNGGWNTPTTLYRLSAVLPSGFGAFHHKKQLKLIRYGQGLQAESFEMSPHEREVIYPATHDTRVKI